MAVLQVFITQLVYFFRLYGQLYLLALCYFMFAVILRERFDFPIMWTSPTLLLVYGGYMLGSFFSIVVIYQILSIMTSNRSGHPSRILLHWLKKLLIDTPRLANGLHLTILICAFFGIFWTLKSAIPYILPFAWDPFFYEVDKILFGGTTAWLSWNISSFPPVIIVISNFFYNLWLLIVVAFLTFFVFYRPSTLQRVFLISSILTFILCGNILAILFSSAGPCFYGRVVEGYNPYADHLAFLKAIHEDTGMVWAVYVQDALWSTYVSRFDGAVSGISAMPSLHVAFAVLMALASWRISKALGTIMILFAGTIMFGSVVLAWHYAVDGILGGVVSAAIWLAVSSCHHRSRVVDPSIQDSVSNNPEAAHSAGSLVHSLTYPTQPASPPHVS